MGCSTLNPEQMSPLTRKCYGYEQEFIEEASQDQTLAGKAKVNLAGRVIALGVSLCLHSEAVCRAVYICFLIIREIFSPTDEVELKTERLACTQAYGASVRSFIALFNLKLLESFPDLEPVRKAAPSPMRIEPMNVDEDRFAAPSSPIAGYVEVAHQAEEPFEHIDISSVGSLDSDFSSPSESPILVAADDNIEELHINIPPLSLPAPTAERLQDKASSPPLSPLAQAKKEVDLLATATCRSSVPLLPQEEYRGMMTQERIQRRIRGLAAEYADRGEMDVGNSLVDTFNGAQKQIDLNHHPLNYVKGPESQYQDPKWTRVKGKVGDYEIGFCQYALDNRELKTEFLTEKFDVKIGKTEHPIHLFALCDPKTGLRASQHVRENLKKVLIEKLREKNPSHFSMPGIWNAISQTFLKLNRDFLIENKNKKLLSDEVAADHGTSASVAIIIDGTLWVAHVGNSRVVLNYANTGRLDQLTEDPDPQIPKYHSRIEELGGFVSPEGLVNGGHGHCSWKMATTIGQLHLEGAASSKPDITRTKCDGISKDSYLFFGTRDFFETTSSREIGRLLQEKRNVEPDNLAHDLTYSMHLEKRKNWREKDKPLACLLIKFPKKEAEPVLQPEIAPRKATPLSSIVEEDEWEKLSNSSR